MSNRPVGSPHCRIGKPDAATALGRWHDHHCCDPRPENQGCVHRGPGFADGQPMKPAAVFSEAWRNLLSGASRAVWFILALTIFGAGLWGIADVSATGALISKANAYKASGAAITTFVAQGQIDGRQCAQLSEVPGVTAAGAMRSVDNVKLLALPGSPFRRKKSRPHSPRY